MSRDFPHWAAAFEAADPDRAAALLLVPPRLRPKLAALYAVAGEMARAARISPEPALSEIRLQWWIEAVAGLPRGAAQHPVLTALAEHWGTAAPALAGLGEAERGVFSEETHEEILTRIDATAGAAAWLAASALGAGPQAESAVRAQGRALGIAAELAHWEGDVAPLREAGWQAARDAAAGARTVPRAAAPVLFAGPAAQWGLAGREGAPDGRTRRKALIRFALTRNWRFRLPS